MIIISLPECSSTQHVGQQRGWGLPTAKHHKHSPKCTKFRAFGVPRNKMSCPRSWTSTVGSIKQAEQSRYHSWGRVVVSLWVMQPHRSFVPKSAKICFSAVEMPGTLFGAQRWKGEGQWQPGALTPCLNIPGLGDSGGLLSFLPVFWETLKAQSIYKSCLYLR